MMISVPNQTIIHLHALLPFMGEQASPG